MTGTPPPRGAPLHVVHGCLTLGVGGLEHAILGQARAAVAAGHRVTVICVESPGELAGEAERAGARVVSLGKPPGRDPAVVARAAVELLGLAPDVVHTHQIGAAWYLGQAAREAKVPVLHTEHGNQFARMRGWRETVKYRLFFWRAIRNVRAVCCVSPEIAATLARYGTVPRRKLAVVPNGVAPPAPAGPSEDVRGRLGVPPGAKVVGTVGRLTEVKRQHLILRAVASLPGTHAVLVGEGEERAGLVRLAEQLGITARVHFAGYQADPAPFLRAFDVFALTSRSEGFPMSLLEAWAARVPVVSTAVGGIPAVVAEGRTGLLVPSGDVAALTAALGRLLADPALAAGLAEAGQSEFLARYTLDRVAAEYERRYRELLPAARRAGAG